MAICNDRRWPETYRMLCLNGAEVVLIGYNTPLLLDEAPALAHLRMFHNHLPMQAGAYQNTVWVAAAAKAGLEDGQALIGGSCIIAPTGEIAAQAMSLDDEMIVHRADLDLIDDLPQGEFRLRNISPARPVSPDRGSGLSHGLSHRRRRRAAVPDRDRRERAVHRLRAVPVDRRARRRSRWS